MKPQKEFGSNKRRPDGKQDYCTLCVRARGAAWRANNPEKYLKTYRAKLARWTHRRLHLKNKFGITVGDYDEMLKRQCGVCAICFRRLEQVPYKRCKNYSVDHDHKTGKVRGLLCAQCNAGLGQFGDSIQRLEAAIDYLKSAES